MHRPLRRNQPQKRYRRFTAVCPREEALARRFADRETVSPCADCTTAAARLCFPMSHSPITPASLPAGGNGAGRVSGRCNNMDLPHKKEQDVLARRCAHTANACQERAPSTCRDQRHDQGDELAKSRTRERLEPLRAQSVQGMRRATPGWSMFPRPEGASLRG